MHPATLLALIVLLAAPFGSAGHLSARDLPSEVDAGAAIVLVVEGSGSVRSSGSGSRDETRISHEYLFTYEWGGVIELTRGADGIFFGPADLHGGGSGRLVQTFQDRGGGFTRTCDLRRDILDTSGNAARGHLSPQTGELLVGIRSLGEGPPGTHDCSTTYSAGHTETSRHWPAPPLSPLVTEGMALVGTDARMGQVVPGLDELNAANALVFSIRLQDGHTILRGGESAAWPIDDGPLPRLCPSGPDEEFVSGSCSVAGTLNVRVVVDPCKFLRASHAVHLAALSALVKPASGSSESQVRAFAVDARQKVGALLGDERSLQLICGEGSDETMLVVADAQTSVLEAWLDVASTHGLSDQGKRDLVAAERGRQLSGGGDGDAQIAAIVGAVIQSGGNYGPIVVKAHSPVALHAWDEAGRHVGWNESTQGADVQIEGANYTGRPGEGQTLTLPSGFYKLATVEISEGRYLLSTAGNASGNETVELLPLASKAGRTLVSNVLLDEQGMLLGPLQRVASASAAFVEPWTPLASEPAPVVRGASAAGDRASNGGAGDGERAGAPMPALLALAALALVAVLARRRR